jgi:hypothetical protein
MCDLRHPQLRSHPTPLSGRDLTGNLPGHRLPAHHSAARPATRSATYPDAVGFPPPANLSNALDTDFAYQKSPPWHGWLKAEWSCLTSFCGWTDTWAKLTIGLRLINAGPSSLLLASGRKRLDGFSRSR